MKTEIITKSLSKIGLSIAIATTLASCNQANSEQNPSIKVDGSSTVYPITQAVLEELQTNKEEKADIQTNFSGTGGGFQKFCAGEIEINNASRPISTAEMKACREAEVAYIELPIAFDALTVVANPQNDWLDSISIEELKKIWSPEAEKQVTRWNQVNPDFPDNPLNLYAPGEDSGTYDYFTEAVVEKAGASRNDYLKSENEYQSNEY